jgi:Flp pilus assembly protein RcpC/CpaB
MKNKLVATSIALGLTLVGFLLVASSCSSKDSGSSAAPPAVAADTGDSRGTTAGTVAAPTGGSVAPAGADLINVTMQLEPQRALGGLLRTGDRVAVVASFDTPERTAVLAEKVAVAGLQADVTASTSGSGKGETTDSMPRGNLLVTLSVAPADAARIVFALEYGRVWLAGENATTPALGGVAVTAGSVSPQVSS